jgi:chromosome partitioning protein
MIGSNIQTMHIATSISDAFALVRKLDSLRDLFDFCLIDTAPTPSLLHGAIYLATDWIVYPTLCEFWSFDGLAESMAHRQAMNIRGMQPTQVAGIVPMRYRSNTLEHTENLHKLRERLGELVWRPVAERIIWAEASTYQVPVFVHAPGSEAACDAWELVDRVEVLDGQ